MVNAPVVTTLLTALPLIVPNNALVTTETFAGPPADFPAMERAKSLINCPVPVFSINVAKIRNRLSTPATVPTLDPNSPSLVNKSWEAIRFMLRPECLRAPGAYFPK